jgi:hypothetical protein
MDEDSAVKIILDEALAEPDEGFAVVSESNRIRVVLNHVK